MGILGYFFSFDYLIFKINRIWIYCKQYLAFHLILLLNSVESQHKKSIENKLSGRMSKEESVFWFY